MLYIINYTSNNTNKEGAYTSTMDELTKDLQNLTRLGCRINHIDLVSTILD